MCHLGHILHRQVFVGDSSIGEWSRRTGFLVLDEQNATPRSPSFQVFRDAGPSPHFLRSVETVPKVREIFHACSESQGRGRVERCPGTCRAAPTPVRSVDERWEFHESIF